MGIDALFMEFVHGLCVSTGGFFTPFFRLISLLGEKSWIFVLISLILCFNKKTRWVGATALFAIFLGWIVSNFGFKPTIMRLRPYTANNLYQNYWEMAGAYPETNYSMPSGHVLGCAAFFISLYISSRKEARQLISTIGIIVVMLMALSRMYFMHHYFSDCVVGVLLAVLVSFISKGLIRVIHKFLKSNEDIGLFNFILNFDLFSKKNA